LTYLAGSVLRVAVCIGVGCLTSELKPRRANVFGSEQVKLRAVTEAYSLIEGTCMRAGSSRAAYAFVFHCFNQNIGAKREIEKKCADTLAEWLDSEFQDGMYWTNVHSCMQGNVTRLFLAGGHVHAEPQILCMYENNPHGQV
jgi:hypothetical protein